VRIYFADLRASLACATTLRRGISNRVPLCLGYPVHRSIRGRHTTYESGAYDVNNAEAAENPELGIEEHALLIKVKNPGDPNSRTKVLVLAGIRGIGTWVAADYLRKYHESIYNTKSGFPGSPCLVGRPSEKAETLLL
jgi:hypothetical protein